MSDERELLRRTAAIAADFVGSLDERSIWPPAGVDELRAALGGPLPDGPSDPVKVIEELSAVAERGVVAIPSGRYFGFVIGGALPATVAASWLATAWDQNTGLETVTPATSELERVALGWLVDLLGLPPGTGGGYVTGATVANFTALAAARHAVLRQAGWDVEADGLFGAPPVTVVVGEEAHPAVHKALGLLGLGRARVAAVPVDGQGRMRADSLPPLSPPAIVCLQAGNVNTGAFDPAPEIVPRSREAGAWVHVDGAFGLWAAASPRLAHLAAGFGDADSWATDAHKWLNVPYDSGLALVRDPEALRAAMAVRAAYLPTAERNPSDFTPELSRRGRGVEVWAALCALGRSGVAELVERNCRQARRFAEGLAAAGHEVLNEVVLNQVLVAFGPPATTERVVAAVQEDGTCWCGPTVWQGRTAMRISVSSWATTDEDVEQSLDAMLRAAAREGAGR